MRRHVGRSLTSCPNEMPLNLAILRAHLDNCKFIPDIVNSLLVLDLAEAVNHLFAQGANRMSTVRSHTLADRLRQIIPLVFGQRGPAQPHKRHQQNFEFLWVCTKSCPPRPRNKTTVSAETTS